MNFRKRLIISFAIVIVVPILLAILLLYGVRFLGRGSDQGLVTDSMQIMNRYSRRAYETILEQARTDPSVLLNTDYLQKENENLKKSYTSLLVRYRDQVYYNGLSEHSNLDPEHLPSFGTGARDANNFTYLEGDASTIVRQIDFYTINGSVGSVYLLTSASGDLPEAKRLIIQYILAVLAILILTAVFLTAWIYSGMVPQVRKLTEAAENIREGNLDFKIEMEGRDEFARLGSAFEEMRARLEDSSRQKLENEKEQLALISNIAHDLKTPITAIKGYAEGILDGIARTPEKQEAYVRTIYNKAGEMDKLINELTTYTKIDTSGIPYNFRHMSARDYFDDCAGELTVELSNQQIRLGYANQLPEETEVIADPEQLQRVISNIVGNSVKYMGHADGHINMLVKDVGDFVQVEMSDDGQGITAADLPYIFDRTFRADSSRNSNTGGSGIGLAVVKKIIEDHGGKVWARSTPGKGTCIYFVLRKYQEEEVR